MSGKNLLLKLGVKSTESKVDIYRDGDVITLVAKGNATRDNGKGSVRTSGIVMQQYDSVAAFEHDRNQLFERFPLAYTKIIGKLGIDDNISKAKPLPENMRHLLPEYAKALPQNSGGVEINVNAEVIESSSSDSNKSEQKPWYSDIIEGS